MQGDYNLTPQDMEDIRTHRLAPAKGVRVGGKYLFRAKIGGESTPITVYVKELAEKPHNLGGTIRTAYVYGVGFRGWVNQKKLLENRKKTCEKMWT
jgi:tRNA G18 (ribose-2'-O)-methylase SpoU